MSSKKIASQKGIKKNTEEKLPAHLANIGLNAEGYAEQRYDWRYIEYGSVIPSVTYSDQPYIVQTDDGAWLCVLTTGAGREGEGGQHVVSYRSTDRGQTWEDKVEVESPDGPEASYAVLLKVPGGRIYCFYNHNTDNIRQIKADKDTYPDGFCRRVDSMGYFVFKYSDDHGRSWSQKRYNIDVRLMELDKKNCYGGKIRFFWNVGKPFTLKGAAYVSLHKVGGIGAGFFTSSEGTLLRSENILTERDPEKITWETLPEGEIGLRTPPGGGPVSEEQSYSVLSDGSIFSVYRTIDGYSCCAYSRDGGYHWTQPKYMTYSPKGTRQFKHPRAATFAWKCSNGRYIYWFHNHGGRWYEDRNPVWLSCGREVNTEQGLQIEWSEPEIAIYDDDPYVRMSYPDMVEENGSIYLTETQKHMARVHELDKDFLEKFFAFDTLNEVAQDGLLVEETDIKDGLEIVMPALPQFLCRDNELLNYGTRDLRQGIALELVVELDSLEPGQVIFDSRSERGKGILVRTSEIGTIEVVLCDGRTVNSWDTDQEVIEAGRKHHVVINVDGGPKIITFVVDGMVCDGGEFRQFGWGRFSPNLRELNGGKTANIAPSMAGRVHLLRLYNRSLLNVEALGNFRASVQ